MLKFIRLKIYIKALENLVLPTLKGSTLRGIFKTSLRHSCCCHQAEKCEQCPDNMHCPYTVITENRTETGMSTVLPYIINSDNLTSRYYQRGRIISFELLLMGTAIDYLPFIIDSLTQWHKLAVSKFKFMVSNDDLMIMGDPVTWPESAFPRGRLSLEKIEQILPEEIITIYPAENLLAPYKPQYLAESIEHYPLEGNWRVRLKFLTPTRISRKGFNQKNYNKTKRSPFRPTAVQFGIIYQALHDRCRDLCNVYGHGLTEGIFPDKQKVMPVFEQIGIAQSMLSMEKVKRFSPIFTFRRKDHDSKHDRQNNKIKWHHHDGFIGTADYDNVPSFMLPLIKAGEILNIGKSTAMGYGRYKATFLQMD